MGMLHVGDRGAQRLQQHRTLQWRQPEGAGQRPVVLGPPGQPPTDPGRGVIGTGNVPVGAGQPLQLVPGHRPGDLRQARLGARRGDPGQRPHLGVGEPAGRELGADHRQVLQRAGDPDVLAGGAGGQLTLPGQPRRAAGHVPAGPAAAGVEVTRQDQEPARRRDLTAGAVALPDPGQGPVHPRAAPASQRCDIEAVITAPMSHRVGQVPAQLADLRLQPLQRHRVRRTGAESRQRSGVVVPGSAPGRIVSNLYLMSVPGSGNPGKAHRTALT
jgi:hypothetical protein